MPVVCPIRDESPNPSENRGHSRVQTELLGKTSSRLSWLAIFVLVTSMRGKNRRLVISVCEGEERSSNHGGEAVPGGTSGGGIAGLARTLLCSACIWHGDLRGGWELGDGDEGDGAHRCENSDALPTPDS
jgi:hypothetical protein